MYLPTTDAVITVRTKITVIPLKAAPKLIQKVWQVAVSFWRRGWLEIVVFVAKA